MEVKAIFKGKDGSMGYRTDQPYTLNFGTRQTFTNDLFKTRIYIHIKGTLNGYNLYDSLKLFLDNWDVI